MARYTLNLHIEASDFQELGGPFDAPVEKVKIARKDKSDYDGFRQSCNIALPQAISQLNIIDRGNNADGGYQSVSPQTIDIHLPFEEDTPKTYIFLGMDISPDFDAIIKLGSGHVIVEHMCNRAMIARNVKGLVRWMDGKDLIEERAVGLINSVDESVFRKIATSLKTGTFYSLLKKFQANNPDDEYDSAFRDFLGMIQSDISDGTGVSNVLSGVGKYESIILNLIGDKEVQVADIQATSFTNDLGEEVAKAFFGATLCYWSFVAKRYSEWKSELAALDLWSDLYKRTVGEKEFNQRFHNCVGVSDQQGMTLDRTVSFTGIAKNGGVSDDNVIRDRAAEQVGRLGQIIFGSSVSSFRELDLEDVLRSNLDTTDIEDVYGLSPEEMQALSVLDSLRYVDEDAAVCRASYDMNDPEQRGLFVKSAIRSYERNFREFKPARNYDVTEALAEMVERGDIESNPVVSQQVLTGDPNNDLNVSGDITTSTTQDLKVDVGKADLVKVLKLVNKACGKVLKNFVENT